MINKRAAFLYFLCELLPDFLITKIRLMGQAKRLQGSIFFASAYYLENNPDIQGYSVFPALHYIIHGAAEGRNPHPLFDTRLYISQVQDFHKIKIDPLSHFLDIGWKQGLNPHNLFDTDYYISQISEDSSLDVDPLSHFLEVGWKQGLNPHPFFHTSYYLDHCTEIKKKDVNPLVHYVLSGNKAGVRTFNLENGGAQVTDRRIECDIEIFSLFRGVVFIKGWAFSLELHIKEIGYLTQRGSITYFKWQGLQSDDVVEKHGHTAKNCRFNLIITNDIPQPPTDIILVFKFVDGSVAREFNLSRYSLERRPHNTFVEKIFRKMLQDDPRKARILEIGARNRSGYTAKNSIAPERMEHVGIDILPGDGVDVVCDAHNLSNYFSLSTFDYVFSSNVFEHLLMPWKAVVEINKVLKHEGIVMIFTHHSFPLHDTPCDHWRFSDTAWSGLFNKATGFEIIKTMLGDPVSIVSELMNEATAGLEQMPAYIHSMVLAKKISETNLVWNVDESDILSKNYPE